MVHQQGMKRGGRSPDYFSVTENRRLPVSHLGLNILRAGPVAVFLLHLTVLFLPTLLLPESWQQITEIQLSPLLFPASRPQGALPSRCQMRIRPF